MQQVFIEQARPGSMVGGELNKMALGKLAYALAGSKQDNIVTKTLNKLWQMTNNRFSHEFAYEAKVAGKTLGMVTCYPITVLNRLALPTAGQLIAHRKLGIIGYHMLNPQDLYSLVTMKEGEEGEYHIGTLAALPESRGMGIGTRLIEFVEKLAVKQGYTKSSLTVVKQNDLARKLYERLGYVTVGEVNKPMISLYRMAKVLV